MKCPPTSGQPVQACIALGSNLGDRQAHIDAGLAGLASMCNCRLLAASRVHETDPVGPPGQQKYLNAAARIETTLPPAVLLERLLEIERSQGRNREQEQRWGPRTLDLDLILYDRAVIEEPGLSLPHPRMLEREFVLAPLAEIASSWRVPGIGEDRTVKDLLTKLRSIRA